MVVGEDRDLIFHTVEPLEIAADVEAVDDRADATKLEAAHARKTTGVEALVDRRIGARKAKLAVQGQDVASAAVCPLVGREVLVGVKVDFGKRKITQELLKRDR